MRTPILWALHVWHTVPCFRLMLADVAAPLITDVSAWAFRYAEVLHVLFAERLVC